MAVPQALRRHVLRATSFVSAVSCHCDPALQEVFTGTLLCSAFFLGLGEESFAMYSSTEQCLLMPVHCYLVPAQLASTTLCHSH